MYCQNCGSQIPDSAKYCEQCGFRCGDHPDRDQSTDRRMASIMVNKKSEALALILSLIIPGLGQIYNGRIAKGLMLLVAGIVLVALSFIVLFLPFGFGGVLWFLFLLPFFLCFVVWIYAMYDAFKEAKEYNQYLLNHDGNPPW